MSTGDAKRHESTGYWARAAELYKRTAEPLTRPLAEAALARLPPLAGRSLLDVAAGTGVLATAAARAGAQVLAVDFAEAMVAYARQSLDPYAGCSAQVMDGQALELADHAFDVSASMFGVMMFPDFRRGLSELVRVTRPAGQVVVGVWEHPHGAGPNLLLLEVFKERLPDFKLPDPAAGMAVLSRPEGLRDELLTAGCSSVEVHRVEGAWRSDSVDDALARVQELLDRCPVPLYEAVDESKRGEVLHGLRSKLLDHVRPDGAVVVPAAANIGIGQR